MQIEFTPCAVSHLPGWGSDDLLDIKDVFSQTLEAYSGASKHGALWRATLEKFQKEEDLRLGIETFFSAYRVQDARTDDSLFTGYFEPTLAARRIPDTTFRYPIYGRPKGLVMIEDLGVFRPELAGQRIAGFVEEGALGPCASRAAIEAGALSGKSLEIAWVSDPVDLYFAHVQGSMRLNFPDGWTRLGYDGTNGHAYASLGKYLIEKGFLKKEGLSMDDMKAWLRANPALAQESFLCNPSYVFFKDQGDTSGPVGRFGLPLAPLRSLAVDPRVIPLGLPLWVSIQDLKMNRLVMAHDVGGAIKGAVRGDLFWGSGEEAGHAAGKTASPGFLYILLPKQLEPKDL